MGSKKFETVKLDSNIHCILQFQLLNVILTVHSLKVVFQSTANHLNSIYENMHTGKE